MFQEIVVFMYFAHRFPKFLASLAISGSCTFQFLDPLNREKEETWTVTKKDMPKNAAFIFFGKLLAFAFLLFNTFLTAMHFVWAGLAQVEQCKNLTDGNLTTGLLWQQVKAIETNLRCSWNTPRQRNRQWPSHLSLPLALTLVQIHRWLESFCDAYLVKRTP
eukprot:5243979-Amphidinium_carterae.1